MAVDLGMSSETGSAPITDDLDQQEAGPMPSSPAPKASQGDCSLLVGGDPEWILSADPVCLCSSELPAATEQSNQQGEPESDATDANQAPPNEGTKVRLPLPPRLSVICRSDS